MFWSRRSKRISLGRTCSKPRCFGRAGQNVSRSVEHGRNIDVLFAPLETYLVWSNLVKRKSFVVMPAEKYLALSKHIFLGRTWSKHRCFDRAGRNVSRLVKLGPNLDVLVAPVKTYLI